MTGPERPRPEAVSPASAPAESGPISCAGPCDDLGDAPQAAAADPGSDPGAAPVPAPAPLAAAVEPGAPDLYGAFDAAGLGAGLGAGHDAGHDAGGEASPEAVLAAAAIPAPPPGLTARLAALEARLGAETAGVALMLTAVFLFSIMDATANALVSRNDPSMVVWARYASQTFWAFLIFAPRLPVLLRTTRPGLQILRSALMFGSTLCFFMALRALPLAEALAIFEVAPLITTGLAVLFLGEKVGPRRAMGVAVGFVGALIIIRPGGDVFTWASFLPMAAAFCFASYAIATRFLREGEPALTSFLYASLCGTLIASLAAPWFWETPSLSDAAVMATFGIIGGMGQYLMILALSRAAASTVAPVAYAGLIFASVWSTAIFGEPPDGPTIFGALVIVGAGLYVWWRERRRGV